MKRYENETFEEYVKRRREDKIKIEEYLKGKLVKPMEKLRPKKPRPSICKFDDPDVLKEHRIKRNKRNKASYKSLRLNRMRTN